MKTANKDHIDDHIDNHINDELLSAYIDEDLDDTKRQRVSSHLDRCDRCTSALEEIRDASNLLGHLQEIAPPDSFSHRVEGRIRRRSRGRFFSVHWYGNRWISYICTAIVLVFLATLYYFSQVAFEVRDLPGDEDSEEIERQLHDDTGLTPSQLVPPETTI